MCKLWMVISATGSVVRKSDENPRMHVIPHSTKVRTNVHFGRRMNQRHGEHDIIAKNADCGLLYTALYHVTIQEGSGFSICSLITIG